MKNLFVFMFLFLLVPFSAPADFDDAVASLHPGYPADGPFIIEISGTWPSDCHPGEQKPLVEFFDGGRVDIGFEIIVEHVTCNDIETPYRVLVDMSQEVKRNFPASESLDIRASFGGSTFRQTVALVCPEGGECDGHTLSHTRPEKGLYDSPLFLNQGLLVARQNGAMGIFPLVYDELGRGEWLFSGNHMVEDSFFTDLMRPTGGDCFGCEPSGTEPELTPIGYISVLADRPGVLQVKVNDGLFTEYRRTIYGYRMFPIGQAADQPLIDLDGRWGISENWGTNPPLGDLTDLLPGAFDIVLEDYGAASSQTVTDGQVSYLVSAPDGKTLGQLVCSGQTGFDGTINMCEFIDDTDQAEPLFLFYQEGPSSLYIEYGRPLIDIGIRPGGRAVRLD